MFAYEREREREREPQAQLHGQQRQMSYLATQQLAAQPPEMMGVGGWGQGPQQGVDI